MVYSMSIQFSKMSIRHRVIYLQVVLLFRYIRILRLVHYLFYHTKIISLFLSTPIYRVYNLSLKTVIYIYIYIYIYIQVCVCVCVCVCIQEIDNVIEMYIIYI